MKKNILHIFAALALLLTGCAPEFQPSVPQQQEGMTVSFGSNGLDDIDISTRSTLPSLAEYRVINFYAIVFDSNGKRIHGHFYDLPSRVNSLNDLQGGNRYSWYVENIDPDKVSGTSTQKSTWGKFNLHCPDVTDGMIYIITNLDTEYLNVTPDVLSVITTEDELKSLAVRLKNETSESTGNFLMIGGATITIDNSADKCTLGSKSMGGVKVDSYDAAKNRIMLKRIASKVIVKIGIVPGAKTTHTYEFAGGTETTEQTIKGFSPISWQIFNLPKGSNLMEKSTDASEEDTGGWFNTKIHTFENTSYNVPCSGFDASGNPQTNMTRKEYGFSWYMLENRKSSEKKKSVHDGPDPGTKFSRYHYRERRLKNDDGSLPPHGDMWEYAPENGTYMVIKGDVEMDATEMNQVQTLNAIATYYVHLGDFGSDLDSYDIFRNTIYTYTINIYGVDKIQVEVERDKEGWDYMNEEQSGATGQVFVASEEVMTFDAHYSQRVFRFNYDKIKYVARNGEVTWYTSTPFGRDGVPDKVGPDQVEVPNGLDYKWVHFLMNSKEKQFTDKHSGKGNTDRTITNENYTSDAEWPERGRYSRLNRIWPEGGLENPALMDVIAFTRLLREETAKRDKAFVEEGTKMIYHPELDESLFDEDGNIYVTAFVDEFYYDEDPITGTADPVLWHKFVNQPVRMMHVLCDGQFSKDEQSSTMGSVVTIRQRAIQTIYDTSRPQTGWGIEYLDETADGLFFFGSDETRNKTNDAHMDGLNGYGFGTAGEATNPANDDPNCWSFKNGLYNTFHLWHLLEGGPTHRPNTDDKGMEILSGSDTKATYTTTPVYWSDYLDYNKMNDHKNGTVSTFFLRDEKNTATLRYTCMQRNRDENGNGVIDKEEVKWYMASTAQLQMLFVGDVGLESESRLYSLENPSNEWNRDNQNNLFIEWRSHVVASTRTIMPNGRLTNRNVPEMIWAEEGCSRGPYAREWGTPGRYSVRCVRNLGKAQEPSNIAGTPDQLVKITKRSDGTFLFDLSNLNPASKRIRTTTELMPMDENSAPSRPFNKFETGIIGNNGNKVMIGNDQNEYLNNIKDKLLKGESYCPVGWHMPNLREAAIMFTYVPSNDVNLWPSKKGGMLVCNYFSFGPSSASGKGYGNGFTWYFNTEQNGNASMGDNSGGYVRCLRDVD